MLISFYKLVRPILLFLPVALFSACDNPKASLSEDESLANSNALQESSSANHSAQHLLMPASPNRLSSDNYSATAKIVTFSANTEESF